MTTLELVESKRAKAVIYCWGSSKAQVRRSNGLSSQETRCRGHPQFPGYEVLNVF